MLNDSDYRLCSQCNTINAVYFERNFDFAEPNCGENVAKTKKALTMQRLIGDGKL